LANLNDYWTHIPSSHRSLILVCGLLFFWILEGTIPLFHHSYRKWRHAGPNLFFTLTTILVNFAFAYLIIKTCLWTAEFHFGLLYLVALPFWLRALVGLALLDLIGAYLIHWIEHRVKWMWKFHIIHHVDRYVDVTTANRHHPVESLFRALFTLLAVWISGSPVWLLMMYQSLSVLFAQFNHANIHFPAKVDRVLSWVIVSPDMHKVHHHYRQPLTDSNYGNIFAFWDRLFGTFTREDPEKLTYGLDTHLPEGQRDQIKNLLEIPFQAYRPRT
jgi:sterol desaturase/sphingolipid hydroxylase (fatty acid hydroxylase superfamily)